MAAELLCTPFCSNEEMSWLAVPWHDPAGDGGAASVRGRAGTPGRVAAGDKPAGAAAGGMAAREATTLLVQFLESVHRLTLNLRLSFNQLCLGKHLRLRKHGTQALCKPKKACLGQMAREASPWQTYV